MAPEDEEGPKDKGSGQTIGPADDTTTQSNTGVLSDTQAAKEGMVGIDDLFGQTSPNMGQTRGKTGVLSDSQAAREGMVADEVAFRATNPEASSRAPKKRVSFGIDIPSRTSSLEDGVLSPNPVASPYPVAGTPAVGTPSPVQNRFSFDTNVTPKERSEQKIKDTLADTAFTQTTRMPPATQMELAEVLLEMKDQAKGLNERIEALGTTLKPSTPEVERTKYIKDITNNAQNLGSRSDFYMSSANQVPYNEQPLVKLEGYMTVINELGSDLVANFLDPKQKEELQKSLAQNKEVCDKILKNDPAAREKLNKAYDRTIQAITAPPKTDLREKFGINENEFGQIQGALSKSIDSINQSIGQNILDAGVVEIDREAVEQGFVAAKGPRALIRRLAGKAGKKVAQGIARKAEPSSGRIVARDRGEIQTADKATTPVPEHEASPTQPAQRPTVIPTIAASAASAKSKSTISTSDVSHGKQQEMEAETDQPVKPNSKTPELQDSGQDQRAEFDGKISSARDSLKREQSERTKALESLENAQKNFDEVQKKHQEASKKGELETVEDRKRAELELREGAEPLRKAARRVDVVNVNIATYGQQIAKLEHERSQFEVEIAKKDSKATQEVEPRSLVQRGGQVSVDVGTKTSLQAEQEAEREAKGRLDLANQQLAESKKNLGSRKGAKSTSEIDIDTALNRAISNIQLSTKDQLQEVEEAIREKREKLEEAQHKTDTLGRQLAADSKNPKLQQEKKDADRQVAQLKRERNILLVAQRNMIKSQVDQEAVEYRGKASQAKNAASELQTVQKQKSKTKGGSEAFIENGEIELKEAAAGKATGQRLQAKQGLRKSEAHLEEAQREVQGGPRMDIEKVALRRNITNQFQERAEAAQNELQKAEKALKKADKELATAQRKVEKSKGDDRTKAHDEMIRASEARDQLVQWRDMARTNLVNTVAERDATIEHAEAKIDRKRAEKQYAEVLKDAAAVANPRTEKQKRQKAVLEDRSERMSQSLVALGDKEQSASNSLSEAQEANKQQQAALSQFRIDNKLTAILYPEPQAITPKNRQKSLKSSAKRRSVNTKLADAFEQGMASARQPEVGAGGSGKLDTSISQENKEHSQAVQQFLQKGKEFVHAIGHEPQEIKWKDVSPVKQEFTFSVDGKEGKVTADLVKYSDGATCRKLNIPATVEYKGQVEMSFAGRLDGNKMIPDAPDAPRLNVKFEGGKKVGCEITGRFDGLNAAGKDNEPLHAMRDGQKVYFGMTCGEYRALQAEINQNRTQGLAADKIKQTEPSPALDNVIAGPGKEQQRDVAPLPAPPESAREIDLQKPTPSPQPPRPEKVDRLFQEDPLENPQKPRTPEEKTAKEQQELLEAVIDGDIRRTRALLARKVDVNARDEDGNTALHYAASQGHKDISSLLLSKGADIDGRNENNDTPLHLAVIKGHVDTSELLVTRGADFDAINKNAQTPKSLAQDGPIKDVIDNAIKAERQEQSQLKSGKVDDLIDLPELKPAESLKPQVTPSQEQPTLQTTSKTAEATFLEAIMQGDVEATKRSLERGVNVNARDEDGNTALHYSASQGHTEISSLLLDKGADIDSRNVNNDTPLHLAVIGNRVDTSELLVTRGADFDALNNSGQTPESLAQNEQIKGLIDAARKKEQGLQETLPEQKVPSARPTEQDITAFSSINNNDSTQDQDHADKTKADFSSMVKKEIPAAALALQEARQERQLAQGKELEEGGTSSSKREEQAEAAVLQAATTAALSAAPISMVQPEAKKEPNIEEQQKAATKIQALQRGNMGRRKVSEMPLDALLAEDAKENDAAKKVQAAYRGMKGRKIAQKEKKLERQFTDSLKEILPETDIKPLNSIPSAKIVSSEPSTKQQLAEGIALVDKVLEEDKKVEKSPKNNRARKNFRKARDEAKRLRDAEIRKVGDAQRTDKDAAEKQAALKNQSATKIQSLVRGAKARKEVKELREEAAFGKMFTEDNSKYQEATPTVSSGLSTKDINRAKEQETERWKKAQKEAKRTRDAAQVEAFKEAQKQEDKDRSAKIGTVMQEALDKQQAAKVDRQASQESSQEFQAAKAEFTDTNKQKVAEARKAQMEDRAAIKMQSLLRGAKARKAFKLSKAQIDQVATQVAAQVLPALSSKLDAVMNELKQNSLQLATVDIERERKEKAGLESLKSSIPGLKPKAQQLSNQEALEQEVLDKIKKQQAAEAQRSAMPQEQDNTRQEIGKTTFDRMVRPNRSVAQLSKEALEQGAKQPVLLLRNEPESDASVGKKSEISAPTEGLSSEQREFSAQLNAIEKELVESGYDTAQKTPASKQTSAQDKPQAVSKATKAESESPKLTFAKSLPLSELREYTKQVLGEAQTDLATTNQLTEGIDKTAAGRATLSKSEKEREDIIKLEKSAQQELGGAKKDLAEAQKIYEQVTQGAEREQQALLATVQMALQATDKSQGAAANFRKYADNLGIAIPQQEVQNPLPPGLSSPSVLRNDKATQPSQQEIVGSVPQGQASPNITTPQVINVQGTPPPEKETEQPKQNKVSVTIGGLKSIDSKVPLVQPTEQSEGTNTQRQTVESSPTSPLLEAAVTVNPNKDQASKSDTVDQRIIDSSISTLTVSTGGTMRPASPKLEQRSNGVLTAARAAYLKSVQGQQILTPTGAGLKARDEDKLPDLQISEVSVASSTKTLESEAATVEVGGGGGSSSKTLQTPFVDSSQSQVSTAEQQGIVTIGDVSSLSSPSPSSPTMGSTETSKEAPKAGVETESLVRVSNKQEGEKGPVAPANPGGTSASSDGPSADVPKTVQANQPQPLKTSPPRRLEPISLRVTDSDPRVLSEGPNKSVPPNTGQKAPTGAGEVSVSSPPLSQPSQNGQDLGGVSFRGALYNNLIAPVKSLLQWQYADTIKPSDPPSPAKIEPQSVFETHDNNDKPRPKVFSATRAAQTPVQHRDDQGTQPNKTINAVEVMVGGDSAPVPAQGGKVFGPGADPAFFDKVNAIPTPSAPNPEPEFVPAQPKPHKLQLGGVVGVSLEGQKFITNAASPKHPDPLLQRSQPVSSQPSTASTEPVGPVASKEDIPLENKGRGPALSRIDSIVDRGFAEPKPPAAVQVVLTPSEPITPDPIKGSPVQSAPSQSHNNPPVPQRDGWVGDSKEHSAEAQETHVPASHFGQIYSPETMEHAPKLISNLQNPTKVSPKQGTRDDMELGRGTVRKIATYNKTAKGSVEI